MKAQKEDRFLRVRQIAYLIYDYFRVTGANDSVENYADLFKVLRNDDTQEFDSNRTEFCCPWRKSHLMISCKDCTNSEYESQKHKTVLEFYNMEISSEKSWTWLTQIENYGEEKYRARFTKEEFGPEVEIISETLWKKTRGLRTPGDCWQWKTNGQCVKGDNCSFRHDTNERAKSTQPNPSPSSFIRQKEIRREPEVPDAECLFHKSESGCRFGIKCSYAHLQVDQQPSRRSQKDGHRSAVAELKITRQLGCVFEDMEPPKVFIDFAEELKHTGTNQMCSIHQSRGTSRWHSRPKSIAWNDLPK